MAKKFNIHNWQSKHIFEQDDFTPDLEDDDLKRSKVQQMMRKEKMLAKDKGPMVDSSTMNLISNIDQTWESYEIMTDDLIQFLQAQHDANGSDIVDDWDDLIDTLQKELEYFREDEEELDEANVTGTGTSISTGDSPAFATPHAFAKNKRKWKGKKATWKEQEEPEMQDDLSLDKLGKDGEIEPDVEYIQNLLDTKINTPEEWTELFHILMSHSLEIKGLTSSQLTTILRKSMQEL